jgi:glyoxylase-like metal-dependent hydrolase (beta-lactamase superfamily II)
VESKANDSRAELRTIHTCTSRLTTQPLDKWFPHLVLFCYPDTALVDVQLEDIHLEPKINAVADGVYQITLTPPIEGFADFISAWLVKGPPTFLVDVGPASTANQLAQALETLGISRLDYILLSHIHLDHAGAVGRIARWFPSAKILCHAKGIPHLVDPAKLWEGTRRVLGPLADGYGPLEPLPAERFVAAQGFAADGIEAVITPGHAAHHVSYFSPAALFAGEACGVHYALPGGRDYMRPATPPTFFMNTALESIDALIARAPDRMVVGHFGIKQNGADLLRRHREQLLFWEQWMSGRVGQRAADEAVLRCVEGLLAEDPLLGAFGLFPQPAQERERYFLKNSVSGFLGWLTAQKR